MTVDEMVGDLERILTYPEQSYQIPQQVPEKVMQAYVHLRNAGYTSHCQKSFSK